MIPDGKLVGNKKKKKKEEDLADDCFPFCDIGLRTMSFEKSKV